MPDVEELLTSDGGETGRAAGSAAVAPAFDAIERRGRRRQQVRQGLVAGAAVVAVVVVVGISRLAIEPGDVVQPAHHPTTSSTNGRQDIDTRRPVGVAIGDDPGVRAVVWEVGRSWQLLVTRDNFATSVALDVPPGTIVQWLDGDRFLVRQGYDGDRVSAVDATGALVDVEVDGGRRPITGGEVPLVVGSAAEGLGVVAVDPRTLAAHRVNVPPEITQLVAFGGKLQGIEGRDEVPRFVWSTDGGTSWSSAGMPDAAGSLLAIVPSAAGQPGQVIEGGDGATLFPYQRLRTILGPRDQVTNPYRGRGRITIQGQFMWGNEVRVLGTRWGGE